MNEMTASKPVVGRTTHFIDGRWAEPGGPTFADRNPYNDED